MIPKSGKKKSASGRAERFEAAVKISATDYKGEHVFSNDRYYDCVEDAIDEYLEGQEA